MSGESEEKTLPPSQRKLRKAREKGQVVTSRDTLASLTTLAAVLYLYARRGAIWDELRRLFAAEPAPGLTLMQDLAGRARSALDLSIGILAPLFALVLALAILGGMAVSGGPVFSFQPLSPNFDKINPASGFKKLFGRAAWMRLLMHIVRVAAIGALLTVMMWGQIGALLPGPPCGIACMGRITDAILVPLLVGLTAILILTGLLDYLVQRAEFIRQQRMSRTEAKREYKEQDGDPMLKGMLRQQQRQMVEHPLGLAQATALIRDGARELVAIRYVEGDTPAPLVVLRARGAGPVGRAVRARPGLPVADDAGAVAAVAAVAVGDWIVTDEQIAAISPHLR